MPLPASFRTDACKTRHPALSVGRDFAYLPGTRETPGQREPVACAPRTEIRSNKWAGQKNQVYEPGVGERMRRRAATPAASDPMPNSSEEAGSGIGRIATKPLATVAGRFRSSIKTP